jgi:siroheme synthase
MGVTQLPRIVERLLEAGAPLSLPAAIVERASLAEQRIVRGTLQTIVESARKAGLSPPALLIVGKVAALARTDLDATDDAGLRALSQVATERV